MSALLIIRKSQIFQLFTFGTFSSEFEKNPFSERFLRRGILKPRQHEGKRITNLKQRRHKYYFNYHL